MWIRLLTSPFWSGTGISLKEDASVIRARDIQADRRSRSSCQLGHAGYAVESLVRARLSHRCLPSNKRGGTLSVCDTTWNCMSLCNCSHQFCKNIPVSFDFTTTWIQGVFLCSPCITADETPQWVQSVSKPRFSGENESHLAMYRRLPCNFTIIIPIRSFS